MFEQIRRELDSAGGETALSIKRLTTANSGSSSARTDCRNNQPPHHGGCFSGRFSQSILFLFGQGWCRLPDPALLSTSLLLAASTASAEINKPLSDWLCDYCSMGRPHSMSLIFPPNILKSKAFAYRTKLQDRLRWRTSAELQFSACSTVFCSASSA